MNSPPFTGNGAPSVGTAATIVTVPAFLIFSVCSADLLPSATLPNLIDLGLSLIVPPIRGVGVADGVDVVVADTVAVADAVQLAST